ncbi:MAG: hypothetical protein M0Q91_13425 [Methanoregula sp.]|nr:hypothetical protein [Methanoregula sp.]
MQKVFGWNIWTGSNLSNHISHLNHNITDFRDVLRKKCTKKKIPEIMKMMVWWLEDS